jgi:hypothetical protein
MKISSISKETLKTVTYVIEDVPDLGTVTYTDYYLTDGRIVDSTLRTIDGYDIDVPSVMEIVQDFIGESTLETA